MEEAEIDAVRDNTEKNVRHCLRPLTRLSYYYAPPVQNGAHCHKQ
jgi:hypothetical protein